MPENTPLRQPEDGSRDEPTSEGIWLTRLKAAREHTAIIGQIMADLKPAVWSMSLLVSVLGLGVASLIAKASGMLRWPG